MKINGVIVVLLLVAGCAQGNVTQVRADPQMRNLMQQMAVSEARFNASKPVEFMRAKEMFPDRRVRQLAVAAADGQLAEVRELVAAGVDVNASGVSGGTPLYWSFHESSIEGFDQLLALGANPDQFFDDGKTVLHKAAQLGEIAFLESAIRHGADVNLPSRNNGRTALFYSIDLAESTRNGAFDRVLAAGGDINAVDKTGLSLLMYTVSIRDYPLAYRLIEMGADWTFRSPNGEVLIDVVNRSPVLEKSPGYAWRQKLIAWWQAH